MLFDLLSYLNKKNVDNHFVYVFQASPKRLNCFERVLCPRYAQASIFTLVAFFNLPISENKIEKRTLFLMSFVLLSVHWRICFDVIH